MRGSSFFVENEDDKTKKTKMNERRLQ